MKARFLIVLIVFTQLCQAQIVTLNPKIKRSSQPDVKINKISLFEDRTEVNFYIRIRTSKELFMEQLEDNPRLKKQFDEMPSMQKKMILKMQEMQMTTTSTISYQSDSYIKDSEGKRYKFLKAKNIPISPKNQQVEPGQKVYFTVTFQAIPKGIGTIDIIENEKDKANTLSYWNFKGITINNPKDEERILSKAKPVEEKTEKATLRIFGKIKDSSNDSLLKAKIFCKSNSDKDEADSLITSKSGSYEFLIEVDSTLELSVFAKGYENLFEEVDLKMLKDKKDFEKDIFLEKSIDLSAEVDKVINKVLDKSDDTLSSSKSIPDDAIGEKENTTDENSLKLDKVYFDLGEAIVKNESFEQLDKLAEYLKSHPTAIIQIEGHTDNQGDKDLNKKLSFDRANNVRDYLIKQGIENKRIIAKGFGDSKPINKSNSEEERRKNRRVEYRFLE
ncbi:MAG: OmpA family protein [Leadbetterella sp.]